MKQKFLILLLFLTSVGSAWGINYKTNEDGTAAVVRSSDSRDVSDDQPYEGNVIIPAEVEYNGKTYKVTSIGMAAFLVCTKLTSIIIPDGVTIINVSAFAGCSGLTSIIIPDGVTSIGNGAFRDCSSLTSINFPDGVTIINEYAFGGCSSLTSITIPEGVTSIGSHAFEGCM